MFKTRVTQILGIQYPIVQGGLMWLSKAELVAAVSNAGGLGMLCSAMFPTSEGLRQEIRKTKTLTDKPFGVNINLFPSFRVLPTMGYVEVLIEEGVKIVESSGHRDPGEIIAPLKKAGVKVIHKVASVSHGLRAEEIGADIVALVGYENGGHTGLRDVTTMVLIPAAHDALKVPLLAGGGIGDARGFVAALALGAEGVLMGTRFMATQECTVHPRFREWLLASKESDTVTIQRTVGNTQRVLRNTVSDKVLELEAKGATLQQLAPLIKGENFREVMEDGNIEAGIAPCGQVVGLIHEIISVQQLIYSMVSEAKKIAARLAS